MGFIDRISGKSAAKAAKESAEVQADFSEQASELLDPFQQLGQQGLDQASFLTDPNAQFDFLQNNPLFQSALEQNQYATSNAQDALFKTAAARGRLSAGDTLQQVQDLGQQSANNLLLQATPLIADQKNSIGNLLNIGQNIASNQGNLLTGQGAALAGGIVGAANARSAGAQNILGLGLSALGSGPGQALVNKGLGAIGLGG